MKKQIIALTALSLAACSMASTGTVAVSGGTWTGKVDGTVVYTGTDFAACGNAVVSHMSSGTIYQANSGGTDGHISLKSSITWNGQSHQISGGGTDGQLYCQNASNVGAINTIMASTDNYGFYFRTVNGQNCTGNSGTANLTFRIDDCKGGLGHNLSVGSPTSSTSGAHGDNFVETYGIQGNTWGTVTSTDRSSGNSLLLNFSSSASGSTVNGTRDCYGCGYASFRVANNNASTSLGTDNATSCGRGFFSVSGSVGCTVSTLGAHNCSSHGAWIQSADNTHVNGGVAQNCHPCSAISQNIGSGNNSISISCQ
jgi:hypothetical protein